MPKGIYNRTPEILEKLKNNFGKEVGFSYWKGKHRSADTKEKLKEYRTGKKHSAETIEKMKLSRKKRLSSGMKGKIHTEATKIAISKKLQGGNSHTWKGGISKDVHSPAEPRYKKWRSDVFNRDNWMCQTCGIRGIYLEAHHIKSWAKYPELRYVLENGVALCRDCHKLTDNYKGKK